MKKVIAILSFVLVLIASPVKAVAGDIPESVLYSEDAQLFFGEVLAYHPDKETTSISVSPIAVIKGNEKEGTKQIYNNPNVMGNFKIEDGKVYLFLYYNEANYIDVFEVTTFNTRTLKLKHVEGDMWERFEEYLNEGKYGEAKVEGMALDIVDFIYAIGDMLVLVCIIGAVILYKKKKNNRKIVV